MAIRTEHIPFDLLIQDEGVAVARRKILNLKGAGVTATDDPTNDRVDIEIPGGGGGGSPGEGHITLQPHAYDSVGQGTFVLDTLGYQAYYGILDSVPGADGNNVSWRVYLAAGTYSLKLLHFWRSMYGIVDIDIGGVEVGSQDQYDPALRYNKLCTVTGISIGSSGLKEVKLRVDGKHASSSGYAMNMSALTLWRTA